VTIFLGPAITSDGAPLTRVYQIRLLEGFKGYR
jgi:hypothetical protein